MLVECCFVDDKDDVQLYDCQKMAEAIVYGITGQRAQASAPRSVPGGLKRFSRLFPPFSGRYGRFFDRVCLR
jgi:N-acetylmuramoyl-L-alanine amidase